MDNQAMLEDMYGMVKELNAGFVHLSNEVSDLKQDVAELKQDMVEVKSDIINLDKRMTMGFTTIANIIRDEIPQTPSKKSGFVAITQ